MFTQMRKVFLNLFLIILLFVSETLQNNVISAKLTKVWGPGLEPHLIVMPARYFFVQAINTDNMSIPLSISSKFQVTLDGVSRAKKPCRIWTNTLDRKDGSFIIRYKLYEPCSNFQIVIKHGTSHVAESPYEIPGIIYPEDCNCPNRNINQFLNSWKCGTLHPQIQRDLTPFKVVNWELQRENVIKRFDKPHSVSLCHYVIKDNLVYRKCYGKYVGFKMFMDSILLSLTRKINFPDTEFFVNLGDWPLVKQGSEIAPIFSWCGSTSSYDIVMPTYDITESSLENMGRVMLDMLSVQGNVNEAWKNRIPKAFWRGRDSNQHRLDLIDISRKHPELFNVSLTNFFFFRDKQEEYGPKSEHVSFFSFFDFKYQLALDGTVAAYRFPYLLAGGSLVIKQESQYFEHFYNELVPNVHYVPMKKDISDLMEKLNWALQNDDKAQEIANNGRDFANENLLPQHIFCYYVQLINEFTQRITSKVTVFDGMELVEQVKEQTHCDCVNNKIKDEL